MVDFSNPLLLKALGIFVLLVIGLIIFSTAKKIWAIGWKLVGLSAAVGIGYLLLTNL